jgi:lysophospholipase L1-like esterase
MISKLVSSIILFSPIFAFATTPWDFKEDRPYVIAAIGDSISVGTNAKNLGVNPDFSWVAGASIKSHRKKIEEIVGKTEFYNFASNGAGIEKLVTVQIPKVLALKELDYLTILVGANDLCHWDVNNYDFRVLEFHQALNQSLQRVFRKFQNVTVLLLAPPNLVNLKRFRTNRCQLVWNVTKICPSLLFSRVTNEDTIKFGDMAGRLNSVLNDMSRSPIYGDLRFNETLFEATFDKKDVSSIDCFHPSALGQQKISDATFDSLR